MILSPFLLQLSHLWDSPIPILQFYILKLLNNFFSMIVQISCFKKFIRFWNVTKFVIQSHTFSTPSLHPSLMCDVFYGWLLSKNYGLKETSWNFFTCRVFFLYLRFDFYFNLARSLWAVIIVNINQLIIY